VLTIGAMSPLIVPATANNFSIVFYASDDTSNVIETLTGGAITFDSITYSHNLSAGFV